MLFDDQGSTVPLTQPVTSVVSLVPSLTEAVAATTPGALVGATDWCTQPPDLAVTRVRGTKNPNIEAIDALKPDLVIANEEENRRVDIEEMRRRGIAVWVTRINTVDEALASMSRLFTEAFDVPLPDWLEHAREEWSRPPREDLRRVALPIWRKPWRWVGPDTFATDLMSRLGWVNVVTDRRYPLVSPDEVAALSPEVIVLPDEPYHFTAEDDAWFSAPTIHVTGRSLFWYGPAMATAREELDAAMARVN